MNDASPLESLYRMGADQAVQGLRIGSLRLADALKGARLASLKVGTSVVLLDVLDGGDPGTVMQRR
ncbi:hypothetical protein C8E00_101513 [Chromohalobacter marismortui]|uniref:Uncharacterized protein n=1 Tax=Chromohalobacter marismortui TaxID=42055 RepID=A0A4R7NWQ8_9GAMM|nr:hypothetical protein C8E00_101513 [Chromohalobacter marismortui]